MIDAIPRQQWVLFGAIALAVPLSAWRALYPQNTRLQVGPVALGIAAPFARHAATLTRALVAPKGDGLLSHPDFLCEVP